MTVLKSLFAYAGKYKYLTILSLVFSMISAILLLMPFIMIWKVIEVILAEYPLSKEVLRYNTAGTR